MVTNGIEQLHALYTMPRESGQAASMLWQAKDISRSPGFRTRMPSPVFMAVWSTVEGNADVCVAGRELTLAPGDCLLCPPRVERVLQVAPRAALHQHILLCHASLVGGLIDSLFESLPVYVPAAHSAGVASLLDRIFDECRSADRDSMRICDCLLEILLRSVRRLLDQSHPLSSPSRSRFEQCRGMLQAHCEQLGSLRQLADSCGMQPGSLCRLFKRHGASSPYQALLRAKMGRAAELLLTTPSTVKSIGARVGYVDPYEFSRAFKRVMGMSPKAYRRERG